MSEGADKMYPTTQFVELRVSEVDDNGKPTSELMFNYINADNIAMCFAHPVSYRTIIRVVIGYQTIDYIVHSEDCAELMDRINKNKYERIVRLDG